MSEEEEKSTEPEETVAVPKPVPRPNDIALYNEKKRHDEAIAQIQSKIV